MVCGRCIQINPFQDQCLRPCMALHAVLRGCLTAAASSESVALRHGALRHLACSCLTTTPAAHPGTALVRINAPHAPAGVQLPWRLDFTRGLSSSTTESRLQAAKARASKQRTAAAAAAASPLRPPPPADPGAEAAGSDVIPAPAAAVAPEPRSGPVEVSEVVGHPALIVTKSIEWGTVIFGFEQATKYTVYDQDGNVVALIAEQVTGLGNEIARQLLRTRRSFTSTVLSPDGTQVVFKVRRPAYLVNSWMYVEDPEGNVVGEVRQRWHPWRRLYDLFLGKRQFATIQGGFLAWDFELKDAAGGTLALIDRNFIGFGKELFTDAGQYAIHFGYSSQQSAQLQQKTLEVRSGKQDVHVPEVTAGAGGSSSSSSSKELAVIPTYTGNQLVVARPLSLDERMLALACAIAVDYNYFSRMSSGSGFLSPPLFMPVPLPSGSGGGVGEVPGVPPMGAEAAGGLEGAGGAAAAEGLGTEAGFTPGADGVGGFADDAETFKWDTGAVGGEESWGGMAGGAGAGGEESSWLGDILRWLWDLVSGGD